MMPWHLIWPWVAQPILFCTLSIAHEAGIDYDQQTLTKLQKSYLSKIALLLNGNGDA